MTTYPYASDKYSIRDPVENRPGPKVGAAWGGVCVCVCVCKLTLVLESNQVSRFDCAKG